MAVPDHRLAHGSRPGSLRRPRLAALALGTALALAPAASTAAPATSPAAAAASYRTQSWSRPTSRAWNAGAEVAQRVGYDNAINSGKTPQQALAISNAMAAAAPFALAAAQEERSNRAMILGLGSSALAALGLVATATGVGAAIGVPMMLGAASIAAGTAATICVSTSCGVAIKADPNDPDNPKIVGPDVNAVGEDEATGSPFEGALYTGAMYQGQYGYDTIVKAYAAVGYFTTFPCKAAYGYAPQNAYHTCLFIPLSATGNSYAAWGLPNKEMFQYFGTGIKVPPIRLAQSGESPNFSWQGYVSQSSYPMPGLFVSGSYVQGAENVPHKTYNPVPAANGAAGVSGAVTAKSAAEPMSPQAIAALANEIAKRIAANGLPEAYNANAPATVQDAQAWQERNPDRVPSVADVYSPITANGTLPKPTTEAKPAVDPIDVNVVNNPSNNPSTGTNGSTGTGTSKDSDEPDTDLDNDSGLLGDPFGPARDFLTGPFKSFLTPGFKLPDAPCPVITIDLPKMLGGGFSSAKNSQFVCDWMTAQRPLFLPFLHVIYLFGGLVIVFKRS